MSLCKRALLLSVVMVFCTLLPTTFSSSSSRRLEGSGKYEGSERSELIDLLKKLRQKLNEEKEAEEAKLESEFDNVKYRRPDSSLTEEQRKQIVDAINTKRRGEGASNMNMIHWNDRIADLAQVWANECNFQRGVKPFNADSIGHFTLGPSLWAFDGTFDANKIVDSWYNDRTDFDPDKQQCVFNQHCGGYRQLVDFRASEVGCGMKQCPSVAGQSNLNFIVCYFGPTFNYFEKPFMKGSSCTECHHGQFYCNNGLCDKTCHSAGPNCECKASCKNCGTMTSNCRCKCKPGSSGVDCGDECTDFNEKCNAEWDGWPKAQCNPDFPYVLEDCPKMCGLCTDGTPCGREERRNYFW